MYTFFKFHPIQPFENISFNPTKIYYRVQNNVTFKREWLSLCKENNKLFCSFCLAFGKEENRFTEGCSALLSNNPCTRIKEHEKSVIHENISEAFLIFINFNDIQSRLDTVRRFENERRRAVLQIIIDTVKLIEKRELLQGCEKFGSCLYLE